MSSAGSVRQRNNAASKKPKDPTTTAHVVPLSPSKEPDLDDLIKANVPSKGVGSEWDYKLALAVITILAFITRFWGISHPNEVVFDEVHFGKVRTYLLFLEEHIADDD